MSKFVYLIYGIAVLVGSTTMNLSYLGERSSSPSNWGSYGSGGSPSGSGGWSSGGQHK